jgi:glycosyltransferase involved in cell wall biosynthesis
MRIGIDIRPITAAGLGRGLAKYTLNLVTHLLTLDSPAHYCLFVARNQPINELRKQISTQQVTFIRLQRPTRNIFLWDQLFWYSLLKKERIDVFHSPVYGVPLFCPCKKVLTIHDLTPVVFPECIEKFRHKVVFRFNFLTGKFADRIITSSQHTKQDLMGYLHTPEQRITVIPDGVAEQYGVIQDTQAIERLRSRYRLPDKYLLYVGGFDKNKNLDTIVRALQLLVEDQNFPDKVFLVMVGNLTPQVDALRELVNTCHLEDRVLFTGFVPEEDLIGIYNGAALFVFPSWYEGFGLPPLEAMACGVPVIISNAASLPEVVGDAGIQVDPSSVEELCHAISQVLTDQSLREAMHRKGIARAKLFSWKQTAWQTLNVYRDVFTRRKPSYERFRPNTS